ncbi:glycosyltransferase [Candidatus Saccharibacteria bacterium]|nr:glycosyltransferase [Candidatus Saccharibacteria bacterium]
MRILIANDLHWPMIVGVATSTRTLAIELSRNGHEVLVLAPSRKGHGRNEIDSNYTITRVKSVAIPFQQNLRLSLSLERRLTKEIKEFKPDLVHIHTQFSIGLGAMYVAHKMGIPIVATNHVLPDNIVKNVMLLTPISGLFNKLFTRYGILLYKDADHIIMPTQSAIDMFNTSSIKSPITPISNGIDLDRFYPHEPDEKVFEKFNIPKKPIISYVGRVDGEKEIDTLVWAAELIRQAHDAHFLIVGGGSMVNELKRLARRLGVFQNFTFTGRVSDDDLEELQNISSIFIMTSPAELQSLATLEAMACETPVIAVDAGALSEICQDGVNGFLIEPQDFQTLAARAIELLDNKKKMEKFAKASLEISQKHNIKNVVKEFEEVYQTTINR